MMRRESHSSRNVIKPSFSSERYRPGVITLLQRIHPQEYEHNV